METDGHLFTPTMATTTTTVDKQTQPQNAEQQQMFCQTCKKKQDMSLMKVENVFVKSRNAKVKNYIQKHTHPVDTANELTTQQTRAGRARTRLTDLKGTKLTIVLIQ